MRKLRLWSVLPAATAGLAAGCQSGSFSLHIREERPAPVRYVQHSHVCTRNCHDHYYDGTRVVIISGRHHHGPHCGHYWDGHYWVLVRRTEPREPVHHVCTRGCHRHYYDGARLITIRSSHRHGRGCGHRWDGRHWVLARGREARPRADRERRAVEPRRRTIRERR